MPEAEFDRRWTAINDIYVQAAADSGLFVESGWSLQKLTDYYNKKYGRFWSPQIIADCLAAHANSGELSCPK
jgi:hypothetical protein